MSLSKEDFSLLSAIETGMRAHEWVPLSEISELSGLSARKVAYRLGILFRQKLVMQEVIHYEGYQIEFAAYDLLALSDLVKRDYVRCIGDLIGVGKESIVYGALDQSNVALAIKFHRQGRTSFKHVRRVREHLANLPRVPWLYAASIAARHEFDVMKKLYPLVAVPKPFGISRHALSMEFVKGHQLSKVTIRNPEILLDEILEEVRKAYRLGIVHADLSEFNIIVGESGPTIIDWPQAVSTSQPHAFGLLERDLSNVLSFFARKYKINLSLQRILDGLVAEDGTIGEEALKN